MIHLRLLSTPPRGDAVTFGYRPESTCLEGTCTPLIEYTLRRTRACFARRLIRRAECDRSGPAFWSCGGQNPPYRVA